MLAQPCATCLVGPAYVEWVVPTPTARPVLASGRVASLAGILPFLTLCSICSFWSPPTLGRKLESGVCKLPRDSSGLRDS